tara:strand:- start:465 stop:1910 length:1446 start_codon:yes stop_codon:yes gene_type:complete
MKFTKLKIFTIIFFIASIIGGLILAPYTLNKQDGVLYYIKQLVPEKLKIVIKKNFLEKDLLENKFNDLELAYKKTVKDDYILNVSKIINLKNNRKIISKNDIEYSLKEIYLPFRNTEAHGSKPGAYIEKYNENLIIASGDAKFIRININQLNNEKIQIHNIENNFKDIIKNPEIYLNGNKGLRDLKIINNYIFLTYPKLIFDENLKRDCFTLGILFAKIDLNFLNFKEFFSLDKCPENGDWESTRSGGRLEGDKNTIYLTVGDFGDMIPNQVSQDKNSFYGKIISISRENTSKAEIVSMGHRNPQGLLIDKEKNYLLSSEHGPNGGDEVNLINLNDSEIENFGWPISSYGDHYPSRVKGHYDTGTYPDLEKYAPLFKSHKKYGFIEPLINWTPSIGVSQIILNEENKKKTIYVAAMGNNIPEGDRTVHEYIFSEEYDQKLNYDKIVIGERIRDMIFNKNNNELLMILETTPVLGILKKIQN